jgi:prepilin-type N-terminal cleavage/methylation domain-containing protein
MAREMHTLVRLVRNRFHAAQEGFTLIELMAAMFVLAVGVFAIADLTSNQLSKGLYTRERDTAIGEVNRQVETLRSTSFTNLQLNPNAAIPGTYTDDDGSVYTPLVAGAANTAYVNYQQAVTISPFSFTVTTIIAAVDDPSDGIGAADQNSNTVDYKKAIVTIHSTDKTNFTYKVETIVRDTSNDPITPVQGLEIQILDANGDQVQDDNTTWTIDVSGAGVSGDEIVEGEYDSFALATGTFTCTISNTDDTREWYPQGQVNATSESFTCTVTPGQITTYQRTWVQPDDCQVLAGQTGDLTVIVTDNSGGAGLVGASVDPTPSGGQAPDPAAQTTGSLGGTTFTGIPTGPYNLSASMTGYTTKSGNQACVTPTQGDPTAISLQATVGNPNPATVNVLVKYTGGGTKAFKVYLSDTVVITQDISKNQTKTFTFMPQPGTYYLHIFCVAGNKENLKESVDPVNFSASTTYYYPGPTSSSFYSENKC